MNSGIVGTIITLADNLGMEVVAEGVETATQVAQLKALRCEFGQGYWFARPADPAAIELLRQKGAYKTNGRALRPPFGDLRARLRNRSSHVDLIPREERGLSPVVPHDEDEELSDAILCV